MSNDNNVGHKNYHHMERTAIMILKLSPTYTASSQCSQVSLTPQGRLSRGHYHPIIQMNTHGPGEVLVLVSGQRRIGPIRNQHPPCSSSPWGLVASGQSSITQSLLPLPSISLRVRCWRLGSALTWGIEEGSRKEMFWNMKDSPIRQEQILQNPVPSLLQKSNYEKYFQEGKYYANLIQLWLQIIEEKCQHCSWSPVEGLRTIGGDANRVDI